MQAFRIHIEYASRRGRIEFKWMWGNNRRLVQGIARLNPTRWSSWKDARGTLIELQSYKMVAANSSRPVDIKIERECIIELKAFKSIGKAIEFLSELMEQQNCDDAQTSVEQEPHDLGREELLHLRVESLLQHREDSIDSTPGTECTTLSFMSGGGGTEVPVVVNQYEGHPAVRVFHAPRRGSEIVAEIDSGTEALCTGEWGEFVRVQWKQLEGWVGRKNVTLSTQASLTVSQFEPLSRGDSATSAMELTSTGKWPTSPATPYQATSNPLLHGVPVQARSPKLESFHAAAPDHFGDVQQGTKHLAEKLLGGGMQLAKDMEDTVGTGDDALMGTPVLTLDVPDTPCGWGAVSERSGWTVESATSRDPAWAADNVDCVVEAMRTSGGESMNAPSKGQTLLVPESADERSSPAPDEARIQEAQNLLANMLMPDAVNLRHWRSRSGRRTKHRRKSAPPPGETGEAVQPRRRALSTEAIAEANEVSYSSSPQPLQPLNGSMPGYLSPRNRRRQKSLTPQSGESHPLL